MATFSKKDQMLLTEAYSLQLLKESMADMSLSQIDNRLHLMSESELEYVATVNGRILSEAFNFGGLKNIGGAIKQGVGSAAAGAANRIGGAYQGAKQKVGGMVDTAVQGAKNVGSGIASAAGEVAGNVEDIYKSGQQAGTQADLLANAKKSIDALTDALRQTDEAGLLGNNRGQFMNLPLKNILAKLEQAQSQSQTSAQGARDKGVFGGAGQAFRQGMQS
jgi:hypothetical protein